jgi:DNA repair protein RadA/Sms
LALASSFLDRPLPPGLVERGELGLTGEVRSVGRLEARLREAARLGFRACLVPAASLRRLPERAKPEEVELIGVSTLAEAIGATLRDR